jgi:hypothetical protein
VKGEREKKKREEWKMRREGSQRKRENALLCLYFGTQME